MSCRTLIVALACLSCGTQQAGAVFVLIDDFEDYTPGPIDDQGDWFAASTASIVTADPADEFDQVLAVATDSTRLYRDLLIANTTVRVLFFRFRFHEQLSVSYGMSDSSSPDQFGDFEVELSLTNASPDLRINDGGSYEFLHLLEPDVWYNVWIRIDNALDESTVYLHHRPFSAARADDLLDADGQIAFEFRDSTAGDLRTFYIKTGGGSSQNVGPLYIDDIYLQDSPELNLHNPSITPPDLDANGYVDALDYAVFCACLAGPGVTTPEPACPADAFDLCDVDDDGDVDLRDYSAFEVLFRID